MAGERGGPPAGPLGSVVDLGALRRSAGGREPEPDGRAAPPLYANDVQPTIETDGAVTLFFRHIKGDGVSDVQAVTMPPGLFLALVGMSGQILGASHERILKQGQHLGAALAQIPGGPA